MKSSKTLIMTTICATLFATQVLVIKSFAKSNFNHVTISSSEVSTLADIATIDKNEILLAIIASNKQAHSKVVDFAKLMIEQHGSNLSQLLEIANQFNVMSLTGNESSKLAAQGNEEMMKLSKLQGDQFDRAYVDAMVTGHEAALKLIDNHLMKTAKTESIKKFLSDTRSAVVSHLDKAKKLQANE